MRQYSHAKGYTPDKLAASVNAMMAEDWQPIGSPQQDMDRGVWIQAMVRETVNGNGDVRLREPKKR